ncbi:thiamine diphosphokinase [Psychrobacillus insolitus]|uniref:Thiamine diphosphokinase n=1 Tax=Psychrobacillus insolitus TaxID=1461 RepID=A0A2W7NBZ6_9BACI|nr:thiamine diphosphokinase [Psychrobacillus insolitus]PZX07979.1 thiamine diphosphokinase [Psychrobacillus insolitus]
MKRVVICSGGPKEEVVDFKQLPLLKDEIVFIGADRGAMHLIENGIIPNEIIGDFDSLLDDEFHYLEQKVGKITKLQEEKDETDTHIAVIQALTYKPDQIILTAVTGGRLDHYEAVLHDMFQFQMSNPDVIFSIQNKQNIIRFLLPGTHLIESNHMYKYISFFSFGETVEAVWLRGFLYEVTNENIAMGNSKFTSNEVIGQTSTISFTKGICLMIRSSD